MSKQDDTKADKPIEDLLLSDKTERNPREPGGLKEHIWISDDFDEPMSEEELALWYEGPIFPEDETQNK